MDNSPRELIVNTKTTALSPSRRAALRFLAGTIILVAVVTLIVPLEHRFFDPVRPILRDAVAKINWFFASLF